MENLHLLTPPQELVPNTVTKESFNYNQIPTDIRSRDHLTAQETSDKYVEEFVLDYEKVDGLRQKLAQRQALQDSLDPKQKEFVFNETEIIDGYLKPFKDKFSSNEELTEKVQQALASRLSLDDETYNNRYNPVNIFKQPEVISSANNSNETSTDDHEMTPDEVPTTNNQEDNTSTDDHEMTPDEALATLIEKRSKNQARKNHHTDEDNQKTQEIEIFMPEIPAEIQNKLTAARKEFAKATAKIRFKNFLSGRGTKASHQTQLQYEEIQNEIIKDLTPSQKIKFLADDREKFYEDLYQEKEALQPKNKTLRKLYNWLGTPNPEKNKNSEKLKRVAVVGALALAASGVVSLALPALVGGVVAGSISLAATRGGTEALLSRKLNAQKDAIQNPINNSAPDNLSKTRFTENVHQESKEIAKSNRKKTAVSFLGGLLVGSIFAFGVGHIAHALTDNSHVVANGVNHAKVITKKPSVTLSSHKITSNNQSLQMVNTKGFKYPWNYFAKYFKAKNATPTIEKDVQKLLNNNWKVIGNKENTGISEVVSPAGKVYNDTQGIVSALLQKFKN